LPTRLNYKEDQIQALEQDQLPDWIKAQVNTEELTLFKADHESLFQRLIDDNRKQQTT